jgi:redox-sensing transcriptional repressor
VTIRPIPEASVARLPVYLRVLVDMAEQGTHTSSSEALAAAAGVNSAKVRKDLSYLGSYGTRGVGYDVEYLIAQISRELGLTQGWATCIVGMGNLGAALANYGGFEERGFRVAALFDSDDAKVGTQVAGLEISHFDDVERIVKEDEISIAILAVPGSVAQDAADRLVTAGITSILNFAPAVLAVPDGVSLRKVDLSIELQILAFYEQRKQAEESVRQGTALRNLGAADEAR